MQYSKKTLALKKLLQQDNEDPKTIDAILSINIEKELRENKRDKFHWFTTIINTLLSVSALIVSIYK